MAYPDSLSGDMRKNPVAVGHEEAPGGFKLSIRGLYDSRRGSAYPQWLYPYRAILYVQHVLLA
jgi:hypothetical protein